MEIKSSTAITSTAETEGGAKEKARLSAKLLDNVDVDKVNAMFQQSLDMFADSSEDAHSTSRATADDCRWDQWGRT